MMPLLLLLPLLAGGVGFGGGFLAANGLSKVVTVGLVLGGSYVAYQMYQKG